VTDHRPLTLDGALGRLIVETFQQLTLRAQKAGTVLAGPVSGPDAPPTFQTVADLFVAAVIDAYTKVESDLRYLQRNQGIDGTFYAVEGQLVVVHDGQIVSITGYGLQYHYLPGNYMPKFYSPGGYLA
jgi:hypothetical protein